MTGRIRLVTFDVLHTIITPRYPIHVQYSDVFAPHLGLLEPESLKLSFKVALKTVQAQQPSYSSNTQEWWQEVIRQTAIGAGANERAVNESLPVIVPALLKRFSSKEGYAAFDDAIPTIKCLNEDLGVYTGVISNADYRIRLALKDLGFPDSLKPIILSEEIGAEKPSKDIFYACLNTVNTRLLRRRESAIKPEECLHVGDELKCDYEGASGAGMHALLLRRIGEQGAQARKEDNENLRHVPVIPELHSVITYTRRVNKGNSS